MNPKDYIAPHLKYNRFSCRCCGKLPADGIDPVPVLKLETLRKMLGNKLIIIRTGYSCLDYNKVDYIILFGSFKRILAECVE